MRLIVEKTECLVGNVRVPPSKSHTHRAVVLASLASGTSTVRGPLLSEDTMATVEACEAFGACIDRVNAGLQIKGVHGKPQPPEGVIDARNSGTTIRFMTCVAALCNSRVKLTGDESVQGRPIEPLLKSLNDLGAEAVSLKSTGYPLTVTGKLKGGKTIVEGISSQFLSGLLITCPLADLDSELVVVDLKSKPYVEMTLVHLERVGIKIHYENLNRFKIPGGQRIQAVNYMVPGDYSSAAFLMAAAYVTKSKIDISGLYPDDTQGDKTISGIIEEMKTGSHREIDLKDTPDLLPIVAVLGCYTDGTTVVKNVEHARLKESDRIASICSMLNKMGADIEELEDGLKVKKSRLKGGVLDGHRDHRIVMALAVAGLGASGTTVIDGAEVISVSFPGFVETMKRIHANIYLEEKNGRRYNREGF